MSSQVTRAARALLPVLQMRQTCHGSAVVAEGLSPVGVLTLTRVQTGRAEPSGVAARNSFKIHETSNVPGPSLPTCTIE